MFELSLNCFHQIFYLKLSEFLFIFLFEKNKCLGDNNIQNKLLNNKKEYIYQKYQKQI